MEHDTGVAPSESDAMGLPRPLGRLVARFVPQQRRAAIDAALAAGRARRVAAVELLAPERMASLARDSLALLLAGAIGFTALEAALLLVRGASALPRGASLGAALVLVAGNLLLYIPMLPLHEALHAAVMLALGGRPRFGARLPFALYCTAPGQLFTKRGYLAVALGPLVLLSVAGAAVIWLAPQVGAYLVFALAGNVSGAVGDLAAARDLRTLPPQALVADTSSGYEAYVVEQV
jgi:hypothetical protein